MTPEFDDIKVWRTNRPRDFLYNGKSVTVPDEWIFVPSGDPGLTRRLKSITQCWQVVHKRKQRIEAIGLWCDAATVEKVKADLDEERNNPAYLRKLEKARLARIAKQDAYVIEFRQAVVDFLNFAPKYEELAWDLADAVTDHSIPVGSGTVARTERIPVIQRAEAAVIAWMRHQTTAYDHMHIARVKGERRAIRRALADRSRALLEIYRAGGDPPDNCPLRKALQ